jgi:DNA-binding CsgD family transcriptional regulator
MPRSGGGDTELVHAIRDELHCLRVGVPPLPRVVGLVHDLLGGELVWTHRPARTLTGWQLENQVVHNADPRLVRGFAECVASIDGEFAWFKPSSPDRKQRNRVVDSLAAVRSERPGFFESSRLYQECLEPLRFHQHHQLRVLVCDGAELLAWFGIFQREEPTARQRRLLAALVPALRKRLVLERTLATAALNESVLLALLEVIAHPAFVVGCGGRIETANTAGLALLADDRRATCDAIEQCRHTEDAIALAELPGAQLVVLSETASMTARAAHAARRWALTPRQTDVLGLVVAGHATATIAELLAISPRAVEYHLTAIFGRTNTQNRAALVAAVALEATR